MKRKIFATVMALVLCTTTLVGCGHKNDSSPAPADYVESDGPAITDGSDTGKNVTATPYTNEQGEILMQAPNDDIIGNEDFEQAPKEENASLDAESMEEEVLSETGEIEGIIVVQNYFYHADDGISNIFVYSIESINPDTGESTKIAEFSVRRPYNVTWGAVIRKDCPLAEKAEIKVEDLLPYPVFCSEQSAKADLPRWCGEKADRLNILATFNLANNGAIFVREGLGVQLTFDHLIEMTEGGPLCFRPLSPALYNKMYVIWKKYQVFTPASRLLLEEVKKALKTS